MLNIKKKLLFFVLLSLLSSLLPSNAIAKEVSSSKKFTLVSESAQKNYLITEQLEKDCNKTQIIEFFSYSCPACHKVEKEVLQFKKSIENNKDITFIQYPVVFQDAWKNTAKLFFTIEKLGITNQLHSYIFDKIQNMKSSQITELDIKKIIEQYNAINSDNKIDVANFMTVFNSNIINRDVKNTMRIFYSLNLSSTPVFVLNGKYIISPASYDSLKTMFKDMKSLANKNKIKCSID